MRKILQAFIAMLILLSFTVSALPQTVTTTTVIKTTVVNVDRQGNMTDSAGKSVPKELFPKTAYDPQGEKKFVKGTATKRPKVMYIEESLLTVPISNEILAEYKDYLKAEPRVSKTKFRRGVIAKRKRVVPRRTRTITKFVPVNAVATVTSDQINDIAATVAKKLEGTLVTKNLSEADKTWLKETINASVAAEVAKLKSGSSTTIEETGNPFVRAFWWVLDAIDSVAWYIFVGIVILLIILLLRRLDFEGLRTRVFGTKEKQSSTSTYKRTITEEPYVRAVDETEVIGNEPHITSVGIRKTEVAEESSSESKLVEAES